MELYQKILSGALFADLYATHPNTLASTPRLADGRQAGLLLTRSGLALDRPADAPRLDKPSDRHARGLIESLILRKPEARLTCSAREQSGLMRRAFPPLTLAPTLTLSYLYSQPQAP